MKRVVGLRMGWKMPVPADRRGVAWRLRAAVASSEAQGLQRSVDGERLSLVRATDGVHGMRWAGMAEEGTIDASRAFMSESGVGGRRSFGGS